ncbi:MAG: glutamine--fructose-6-phosphate transaminase (isomerizing), partial [Gemmatimonadetes bacterium]|nr:glutamine--fructose-6-phosphate transaminase (isomerizing) [Gemmatimonadota bacterium]NIQ51923.1 glutamine--fructose-6-phosphate transaminase (isomerizing) [Gemmatimonadota bacterium]NIU72030.1 glutamine--fructose-6-phosphate transaminase (isomerizing) [Gammaproteobacteria bacterium]NIX42592.1 glutamine--fructose-6-phosphate transaminase (isomerizing) [Gemmatimonadota bacterium]NIY06767.1 glutamine--fructose-6-phosphate transaminase (isomerizing) [Gemmatimonadota bacterium]
MCGIVGYVGGRDATAVLVEGLKRLEYRGYDSAGVAVQNGAGILTRKVKGRVGGLDGLIRRHPVRGNSGIGHTRWATHGVPNRTNAHPHRGCGRDLALVHNGIIENADSLREMLERSGHRFRTETDTETLVHLIEEMPGRDLEGRVAEALRMVEGTFGIAVMSSREPAKIVAARRGSPVLIGVGEGEHFVASDPSAVLEHTRTVVYLEDGDIAVVTPDGYRITDVSRRERVRQERDIAWQVEAIELGDYEHFMLKEIHEQPRAVRDTLRGRLRSGEPIRLNGLGLTPELARGLERITILACGTSWHSGLIGHYLIEDLLGIPVRVEYASEYRYMRPLDLRNTLVIAISQSGETADTLEAMRAAKSAGGRVVGLVNVVGSTIAREADGGIYLHAGPEIGVASTKAFTSQITALLLLALHLAELRGVDSERLPRIRSELERIPGLIRETLDLEPKIAGLAETLVDAANFLYLGRGVNYPVALEGALKLKEISYIHAEGLPAAEMKHGPIALIDEDMPVVFVAPKDAVYDKVVSNIQEVRARDGRVIVVSTRGNGDLSRVVDHQLRVPATL